MSQTTVAPWGRVSKPAPRTTEIWQNTSGCPSKSARNPYPLAGSNHLTDASIRTWEGLPRYPRCHRDPPACSHSPPPTSYPARSAAIGRRDAGIITASQFHQHLCAGDAEASGSRPRVSWASARATCPSCRRGTIGFSRSGSRGPTLSMRKAAVGGLGSALIASWRDRRNAPRAHADPVRVLRTGVGGRNLCRSSPPTSSVATRASWRPVETLHTSPGLAMR